MDTTRSVAISRWDRVPTWEELANSGADRAEDLWGLKQELGNKDRTLTLSYGRFIMNRFFRSPTHIKYREIQFPDLLDVLSEQIFLNRTLVNGSESVDKVLPTYEMASVFRKFNQLPCTGGSVLRRVDLIASRCRKSDPVLFLGDDDFVSVALARSGFTDVTVLDIDSRIITTINSLSSANGFPIEAKVHDLRRRIPASFRRDYQMVVMDPIYTLEGVKMWLDPALEMTSRATSPVFLLCVHLLSLQRDGLEKLEKLFAAKNLRVSEVLQGFNAYKMPWGIKRIIAMVNRFVVRSSEFAQLSKSCSFLTSDALILNLDE